MSAEPTAISAATERIPTYLFPEDAARALGHAAAYAHWRNEPPSLFWTFDDIQTDEARALCQDVVAARGDTWLTAEELRRLLDAFGIRLAPGATVYAEDQAIAAANVVGYPVVLKVESPKVLHKTDVGGVWLHLGDEHGVRSAFRDLAARFPDVSKPGGTATITVQPMLSGVEVIVGMNRDVSFGPLIAFGRGGIETELLRDVAFRIAPLTDSDVTGLLREVRSFPLLQGYRGRAAADIDALKQLVLRISLLAHAIPEVHELDLNPVMALPAGQGCGIVDARVRVAAVQARS
jgi:acetyltransferase